MNETKICSKCHKTKRLEEFSRDKNNKDGRTYDCKKCRSKVYKQWCLDNPKKAKETRDRYAPYRKEYYQRPEQLLKYRKRWVQRYGLSLEEFDKMVDTQRNLCYVCNRPEPQVKNRHLCIDHNHKTGKVRKLLCSSCNRALGLLRENLVVIEKLKQYLIEHESNTTIDSE